MEYTFQMTLAKWLELATQELAPDARRRIRTEIETHYADAFAAAREAEASESEADREALAALGDPYTAWHRFRKTYLSKSEERKLEKIKQSYDMPRRKLLTHACLSGALILMFLALAFWNMKHDGMGFPMFLLGYLIGLSANKLGAYLYARLLFDPRLKHAEHLFIYRVMPLQTFILVALTGTAIYSFNADKPGEPARIICNGLLVILLLIGLAIHFYDFRALLRKIRGSQTSSSPIGPDQYA